MNRAFIRKVGGVVARIVLDTQEASLLPGAPPVSHFTGHET